MPDLADCLTWPGWLPDRSVAVAVLRYTSTGRAAAAALGIARLGRTVDAAP